MRKFSKFSKFGNVSNFSSLLMSSALTRIACAALLVALLWLSVAWALMELAP